MGNTVIMGIDPGYAIVGVGMVEFERGQFRVLEYGPVTTPAHIEFARRLEMIYDELTAIFARRRIDAVAIEELFFHSNATTAIAVAQARGVILLAAKKAGVPVYEYTPLQVKSAVTGYGRAEKTQVQEMVRSILRLKSVPKPDDVADALATAVCHGHSAGSAIAGVYRNFGYQK